MPDVRRILLGSADLADAAAPTALLDRFVEAGGRRLDLANVYAGGRSSEIVGRWLADRRAGPTPTLYVKGCHPPFCAPELVQKEVDEARSLLGVERLDNFILHRDDPEITPGQWAAALRAEIDRGSVGGVGVSNWTVERFLALREAFGDDAHQPSSFSNHLSLAEMVRPTWPGCLGMSSDEASKLAGSGVEVIAWAALAAGFFAGADPDSWDSDANRARRSRAEALASERGVSPVAIALAYVLHRPANVLAAVGTRSVDHLGQLLEAASIQLEPREVAWLEGRRDQRF
jgi:aryl-alcohol dehydrogenase-like predicted oxidoreductase